MSLSSTEANFRAFIIFTWAWLNVPPQYIFRKLPNDVHCDFVLVNLGSDPSDSRNWPYVSLGSPSWPGKNFHTQKTNLHLFCYYSTSGHSSTLTLEEHHSETTHQMTWRWSAFDFMTKRYKWLYSCSLCHTHTYKGNLNMYTNEKNPSIVLHLMYKYVYLQVSVVLKYPIFFSNNIRTIVRVQ